jgi:hypothetical protein
MSRQYHPALAICFDPAFSRPENRISIVERLGTLGYTAFRLFDARDADLQRAVTASSRIWTSSDVIDQVRRNSIRPHTTLLALQGQTI